MKKTIILSAMILLFAVSTLAQSKGKMDDEDNRVYYVIINAKEQYNIWPTEKNIPSGWRALDYRGRKQECLDYIKELKEDAANGLSNPQRLPHTRPTAPRKTPAYRSWDVPLDAEAALDLPYEIMGRLKDGLGEITTIRLNELWEDKVPNLVGKTMAELVPMYLKIAKQYLRDGEKQGIVEDAFLDIVIAGEIPSAVKNMLYAPTEKGNTTNTPVPSGLEGTSSFFLLFKHQGAYIAHFYLTWDEPNSPGKFWKKEGVAVGSSGLLTPNISKNATNIRLKIEDETGLISAPRKVIINEVIQPVTACYRVFGTTLSPGWAKCN